MKSYRILCVYPLNLCEIMRDLVMPHWIWLCLIGFGSVSYEPMRDYAGFGYASLLFQLYFVGFRLCLVDVSLVFGYVSIVFDVSVMFL